MSELVQSVKPVDGGPVELDDRVRAADATNRETSMSAWESIKLYPKVIMFSAIVSACVIMEGYDVNLLQGLFAFPPFQRRYGELQSNGRYELTASWQAGLANAVSVGQITGLFINGWASERFGYKKTVLTALAGVTCFIFILFFAPSVEVLLVGEILCGIAWGVFQTLTTVYASEVCPVNLRGYLTTFINLCWVLGTLLGQGILRAFLDGGNSQWAYRIPFAIQWVWPIPIAIGILFAPESPWWLVRHGKEEKAKKALQQLQSTNKTYSNDIDATVKMMKYTHEDAVNSEKDASYLDCFRGVNLRRTEVTCMNSFNIAMGQYTLGAIGTMISWPLMGRFGRRTLYLTGLSCQLTVLFVTGCLGLAPSGNSGAPWAVAAMMTAYTGIYDMTVGPVCYALVPEIPSGRLRTRTVVLGRNLYNVINIIMNITIPYMLNPNAWNWKAKAGFFYAGLCALCLIWTFFRLPETKSRSYAELDTLFEQRVPARKFKTTKTDLFHVHAEVSRRTSLVDNEQYPAEKTQASRVHHLENA